MGLKYHYDIKISRKVDLRRIGYNLYIHYSNRILKEILNEDLRAVFGEFSLG